MPLRLIKTDSYGSLSPSEVFKMGFRCAVFFALAWAVGCRAADERLSVEDEAALQDVARDLIPPRSPCSEDHRCGGIVWDKIRRFSFGLNYGWNVYAGDFGGIDAWGQPGVSSAVEAHREQLMRAKRAGAQVVRWFVFPDFRGDGVLFDADAEPLGLGATTIADLEAALMLAEELDLYYVLCLFSFNGFAPHQEVAGVEIPSLARFLSDEVRREQLARRVVDPFVRAVGESPHWKRVMAFDIINEPEWAICDQSPFGDPPFNPGESLDCVSFVQMEGFLGRMIESVREGSFSLVTVGSAAIKWRDAWSRLDIDFDQYHLYDWVQRYWPYDVATEVHGVWSRPVVIGEFPLWPLQGAASYEVLLGGILEAGYAGAWGWQMIEATDEQLEELEDAAGKLMLGE